MKIQCDTPITDIKGRPMSSASQTFTVGSVLADAVLVIQIPSGKTQVADKIALAVLAKALATSGTWTTNDSAQIANINTAMAALPPLFLQQVNASMTQ